MSPMRSLWSAELRLGLPVIITWSPGLSVSFSISLTAQLAGGAPLGGPRDRLPLFAGSFHQNDRMRIAEQELDHPALNRHHLERVSRGEGLVRPGVTTTEEGRADHQSPQPELSPSRHDTLIPE